MAKEKSNRKFDLAETKGFFELIGVVSDTKSDRFYSDKEITTQNGSKSNVRDVNFGLVFDEDKNGLGKKAFVSLRGGKRDKVYCFKRCDDKDGKSHTEVKEIKWSNRFDIPEGYSLVGTRVGIEKQMDENGKLVNIKKNLSEYDACEELKEKLMDDESVYVRGTINYYTNKNGEHKQRFNIAQISLLSNDIEFNEEFKPRNNFKQSICFKSIQKNPDIQGEWIINSYVISYSSVEEIEMITRNPSLAKQMSKALKPYSNIEVWGNIECILNTETVVDEDVWGEQCEMDKQAAPARIALVITGANPNTIDESLYSEDSIDMAIASIKQSKSADKDYGKNVSDKDAGFEGDWGSVSGSDFDDDDDDEWA